MPWERFPGEPAEAFEKFLTYLKMERADRSVRQAFYQHTGSPEARKVTGTWHTTAQKYRWEERAMAFDRHADRKLFKQLEARRAKSLVDAADLGELLRKKATSAAKMLIGVTQRVGQDEQGREIIVMETQMSPGEITRMAQVAVELEQLALGNPTGRQSLVGDGAPIGIVDAKEELRRRLRDMRTRRDQAEAGAEIADTPIEGCEVESPEA